MKKYLFLLVLLVSTIKADSETDACRQEITAIDKQIEKLHAEKEKHVELAKKYQADGDRWQFNTGRIQEAHENWGKANDERAKAIDLQLQIDRLYEKKKWIYQFYPELQYE